MRASAPEKADGWHGVETVILLVFGRAAAKKIDFNLIIETQTMMMIFDIWLAVTGVTKDEFPLSVQFLCDSACLSLAAPRRFASTLKYLPLLIKL